MTAFNATLSWLAAPGMAPTSGMGSMPCMPSMPMLGCPQAPGSGSMHTHGSTMGGPMWMPMDPPTLDRLLAWHPQPIPIEPFACLLALVIYALAVGRLRRRGDTWPLHRTLGWTLGVLSIAAVTCTGVGGYGMELFSVHMVQHMVLSMLSPTCCCSAHRSLWRCGPCLRHLVAVPGRGRC